ncbi:MAG: hypothetical protein HY660_05665 [Armatimonadetes bacterium]|nr:hypothetical protein [Armatimonadota bacterium]
MLRFDAGTEEIGYEQDEVERLLEAQGFRLGALEVEARPRLNLYRQAREAEEVDITLARRSEMREGIQVEYVREFRSVGLPARMPVHSVQIDLVKDLLRHGPDFVGEKVVLIVDGTRYELAYLLGEGLSGMVTRAGRRGLDLLKYRRGITLRQALEATLREIRAPAASVA